MSDPVLYVLGTPVGRWIEWARAWLAPTPFARVFALPADATSRKSVGDKQIAAWRRPATETGAWGGLAAQGFQAVDVLADAAAPALLVALVERPAVGLAAALARGEKPDVAAWLDDWRFGARELLRLVQGHRAHCLLLDAEDAAADPAAAWAAVAKRLAVSLPAAGTPAASADDALCSAIAETLAGERADLRGLERDLIAACELLGPAPAPPRRLDGGALVASLQSLRSAASAFTDARNRLDAADGRREALEVEVARSREAAAAAKGELAQAQANAARQQEVATTARRSLADMGEELTRARHAADVAAAEGTRIAGEAKLRQAGIEAALSHSEAALASAAAAQSETEAALAKAVDGQAQAEAARDEALAREASVRAGMNDEQQALRRRADAARQEAATLLAQLHEAQEALEVVDARRRKLESMSRPVLAPAPAPAPKVAAAAPARVAVGPFDIGDAKIVSAHNDGPHLGTNFNLRRVKVPGREIGDASVRLVEHHGHPGLVVFADPNRPPLLESWRETGTEDGRAFMMLMPSEAASLPALEAMGSDDWQLLLALAASLERDLGSLTGSKRERWVAVARRLHEQLLELLPRFRWAGLKVEPLEGGGWSLRFARAHWGSREPRSLTVHWRPESRDAAFALIGAEGGPPLLSWPSTADGKSPAQLVLPLSRGIAAEDRARWQRVPATDRAFVVAMLAAWPRIVAGAVFEGSDPATLARAAETLRSDGERMLAPMPASQVGVVGLLRRAARRFRQSGSVDD